jgi:hypothetical protein
MSVVKSVIQRVNKELERIGAHRIVCFALPFGEEQFQLIDEQWESDFMSHERLLDFLSNILDGAGSEGVWEYLKFEHIILMPTSQSDSWSAEVKRIKRAQKR